MNNLDRRLADLNPLPAQDVADASRSAEATALLHRILTLRTEPRARSGSRPWRRMRGSRTPHLVAAALAAVLAGVWVWSLATSGTTIPVITGPRMNLVAFTTRGDDIVARITDPLAAADELTAVFEAHGLDIHVQALAVSPSLVGTIVYGDVDTVRSLHEGRCLGGGTACWVGLVIPAGFSGEAHVAVGRAASSGETFASSADAFGPGEALHCSGILGGSATSAVPRLDAKGLTAEWEAGGKRTQSPPEGYVVGGTGLDPATVLLDVVPEPLDSDAFRDYLAAANRGC
jgi:hypothetical protein